MKTLALRRCSSRSTDKLHWYAVEFAGDVPAGQWMELSYRASLFDPATRPLLSLENRGNISRISLPSPFMGRSSWIGYVPAGTERLWISPGHAHPDSRFEIECCRPLGLPGLAWRLFRRDTWPAIGALIWFWAVKRNEFATVVRWILDGTPFDRYDRWRRAGQREFDLTSIDRPPDGWQQRILILVVMDCRHPHDSAGALSTIASLRAQAYTNWRAVLVDAPRDLVEHPVTREVMAAGLATTLRSSDLMSDLLATGATTFVTATEPGDVFPAWALALVARYAEDHPNCRIIYGDEDAVDSRGSYRNPRLKPDWSPMFQETSGYMGEAVYYSRELLERLPTARIADLLDGDLAHASLPDIEVGHVRRILLSIFDRHGDRKSRGSVARRTSVTRASSSAAAARAGGRVSIIIPSKDRSELLAECVQSVFSSMGAEAEVIVVDNGSVQAETWSLYERLARDSRFRLAKDPGPFNFARLCNLGASSARYPTLVFLNNDTVVLADDWLGVLDDLARRPDAGAVGARLLYPDRRVQHAGVVLGLWGCAGHMDAGAPEGDPGYLGRLVCTREVAAVTGACLAVERSKFDAVGGFNEVSLPVDLNDIDLCLRLASRGWKTLYTPAALLIHKESASRGRSTDNAARYPKETAYFQSAWGDVIHDDPFFNPALSLNAQRTALG